MTAPVGCAEAIRRLWAYLDEELDRHDRAAVDAHLAWCRRCCGELALAQELRGLLRSRARRPVPADVQARLERVIDGLDGLDGLDGPAGPDHDGDGEVGA